MATDATWKSNFLDYIEPDCMYYKSAVNITSFEKLPNEILLLIIGSLDTLDLVKTARVCRKVQPIAQRVLYGCIEEQTTKKPKCLSLLFETLRNQPRLAGLVKSIVLQGFDIPNHITLYPTRSLYGDGAHNNLDDLDKVHVQVQHARIAGLILWLLPQLTELTIGIDRTDSWDRLTPFAVILGPEYSPRKPNQVAKLRRIPAFQNLKRLRWVGEEFPWSLSLLPDLKSIYFEWDCINSILQEQRYMLGKSEVTKLSIEGDTELLSPQPTFLYIGFKSFLSMFSSLKSIDINMSTQMWLPEPDNSTYCATLFNRLKVMSGTLEKLKFNMPAHDTLSELKLIPIDSLVPFSKVREISMPYYWLCDERNKTDHFDVDFSKLFPQSLEVLEVLVPSAKVCSWIAEFANQRMKRRDFVNLRHIKLTVMGLYDRFEKYEQLVYHPGPRNKLDLMRNQGVRVELACESPISDWDDENYDPVAALFLQTLCGVCGMRGWPYIGFMDGPIWECFSNKAARMYGHQAITLSHIELPSRRIL